MSGKKEITHIDLAGMTSVGKAVGGRGIKPPTKTKGSDKPAKGSFKEKQIGRKSTRKSGSKLPPRPGQGQQAPPSKDKKP